MACRADLDTPAQSFHLKILYHICIAPFAMQGIMHQSWELGWGHIWMHLIQPGSQVKCMERLEWVSFACGL